MLRYVSCVCVPVCRGNMICFLFQSNCKKKNNARAPFLSLLPSLPPSLPPFFPPFPFFLSPFFPSLLSLPPHTNRNLLAVPPAHHLRLSAALTVEEEGEEGEEEEGEEEGLRGVVAVRVCRRGTWHN